MACVYMAASMLVDGLHHLTKEISYAGAVIMMCRSSILHSLVAMFI